MNKIVASLGLVAIGASGLQVMAADDLGAPASKIWNVSASLRGFYDDNINTAHGGTNKVDSMGFEVAPGVGLNWEGEATSVSLNYLYSFKYYDKRQAGNTENYDQTHTFNVELQHAFNSRYHVAASDSFVVGQEPDALRVPNSSIAVPQVIPGNNIRNYGSVVFDAQMTPTFNLELNYKNSYFDYADDFNAALNPPGQPVTPSNSGLLDRDENLIAVEGHWLLQPETTGIVGYQFGAINYTGNELISGNNPPTILPSFMSDSRNSYSHYGYVGANHAFNPDFKGAAKAGVQYTDNYNDPTGKNDVSPYIVLSLDYTYAPESRVEIGFSQSQSPANSAAPSGNSIVRNSDVSLLYGSITHRITPRLFGSIMGTFQNSIYNGGAIDGDSEQFYQLGLNLKYRFNRYFSAEVGYNFDDLQSYASNLSYTRNRVYLGIGATY